MNIKSWLGAFRLRTLPLALSSIGMGSFLAASHGAFDGLVLGLCALTTVFLQILSNLANDYGDSVHGADGAQRQGPSRAVQAGAISAGAMKRAIGVFVILSLASGLLLLHVAVGFASRTFLVFLGLGVLSILAAIGYTMGRRPYGYVGLGDFSVLMFFGAVGVLGSYYLFVPSFDSQLILPALSCGLFSVAVLNVNNIRDIESDIQAGKRSVPVRLGRSKAVVYHGVLLAGGLVAAGGYMALQEGGAVRWIFLVVTAPLLVKNWLGVKKSTSPLSLDPYLKQMAITTLVFVLSFGLSLIFS
jgi:1,4-dihydroxy-2-naphthoate polyprenyltransferase